MNKDFYVNVADLMLPRPRPRQLKIDGEKLDLITIPCGLWSPITWK